MKFVVDRSHWLRGQGGNVSALLNSRSDKMCCLGFCALALGYSKDEIKDKGDPSQLVTSSNFPLPNRWPAMLVNTLAATSPNTKLTLDIIYANDSNVIDDIEREERLKELFLQAGIEIEFED